ncbi:MAG: cytochrome c oxidase assembly protein [Candidatus Dormiibacterota bacterium]
MARPPATALNVDPLLLGLILLVIAIRFWVIRRSAEPISRGRSLALVAAVVLLIGIWMSPLATLAQHYLLAAHLIQVLILMGPVAALLLLSLPRRAGIAPRSVPLPLRLAVHPVVAIVAVNAGFIVWHLTPAYDAALANWWLYDLMQTTLLLVSVLFWWPIVTPCSPPARALTGFGKLGYIVLATIPQTLGGLLVALAGHVLYPGYGGGPQLVGLDAMTDQQIAGASIALVSKVALFAAFWVVFMNLLSTGSDGREDDSGGGGGRGGSSPRLDAPRPRPSGLPRWLDDVGDGRTTDEPVVPRPVRVPAGSGSRLA